MEKPQNQKLRKQRQSIGAPPSQKRKTRYFSLNVLPGDLWLRVRQGETVWDALQKAGVDVGGECGGLGKCGKCKVRVGSAIGPPCKEEKELLDRAELKEGIRLACRTKVNKDLVIYTRETGAGEEYFQILKTGHRPLLHLQPLIYKQLVSLPSDLQDEGLAD